MKKLLYVAIIMGGTIAFTSCAKDEECVCDTYANITESDAEDAGTSLQTLCDVAKIGDESCSIK